MSTQVELFREEREAELLKLADVLESELAGFSGGSLKGAANQCRTGTPHGSTSWGYQLEPVYFYGYQPTSNCRPKHIQDELITIELSLSLAGVCDEDDESDPFIELNLDLLIWTRDSSRRLLSAWHLDKHEREEGDAMYFDHPDYHFQFGGKNIWGLSEFGELLIPEPPRLPHPPLDAILAVNFVLANYFGHEWNRLLNESSEYEQLVRDAQERCWKPYANALGTGWHPGPFENQPWAPNLIWPQLVD